jgi:membrane protease YdiL (CAAX protease family)
MRNEKLRALFGFVWGLLLFLGVAWLLRLGLGSTVLSSAVISQIVLKTVLILVALAGWKVLGRPFVEMGWRRAEWWKRWYLIWFGIAAASMMAGSMAGILLEFRHPIASQMSFLQIVLAIWLLSSCSEEVYVRGLVQSWMADGSGAKDPAQMLDRELDGVQPRAADSHDAKGVTSAFSPSIVSSALLFAGMHVSLLWSPAGVIGGLTIVLSTLGVGWACAVLRARSRSVWPAIACHIVGNVAGIPGGILGVILYRLANGRMPEFLMPG